MIIHNKYTTVAGLLTFKSATNVMEVARKVTLGRLIIETDAPYMRPKNTNLVDRNSPWSASPSMGIWVAAKTAEIIRIKLDIVLIQVMKNVTNLYAI